MKRLLDKLPGFIFLLIALSALSALALIIVFIFYEGIPIIAKVGLGKFTLGMSWAPGKGEFGILPMIIGTVSVTLGAAVLGVPVAILTSIFLTEFAPAAVSRIVRPAIQLLAGIPSVVYGFWGLTFIVPYIRLWIGGPGLSVLAGSVILAIMILPTVISITEVSLLALPRTYKEVFSRHWGDSVADRLSVQLPAAKFRHHGGGHSRHRARSRRNNGCHHGPGQCRCPSGILA
jgi:phosphate transport system permease protein